MKKRIKVIPMLLVFGMVLSMISSALYPAYADVTLPPDNTTEISESEAGETAPLHISVQPDNTAVYAGEYTAFHASAEGGAEPYTYYWENSSDNGVVWTQIEEAVYPYYEIRTASSEQNGQLYRCTVIDNNGEIVVSSSAGLSVTAVQQELEADAPSENDKVEENQDAIFNISLIDEPDKSVEEGKTVTISISAFDRTAAEKDRVYYDFRGKTKAIIPENWSYRQVVEAAVYAYSGSGPTYQTGTGFRTIYFPEAGNCYAFINVGSGYRWNIFVNGKILPVEKHVDHPEAGDVINFVYMTDAEGDTLPGRIDDTPVGNDEPADIDMINALALDKAALTIESIMGENTSASNIETDLNLPNSGANGTAISWKSTGGVVNTNQGGRLQRENINEPTEVVLTAYLKFNDEEDTLEFTFVVPPFSSDEATVINESKRTLNWPVMQGKNININYIIHNLILPTTINGCDVVCTSSNQEYMSNDGTLLKRPAYGEPGIKITITAVVSKNGYSREVSSPFTIAPYTDEWNAVQTVSGDFDIPNNDAITENISLPSSFIHAGTGKTVSVVWKTSDETVISEAGNISRPPYGEKAKTAVLEATFTSSIKNWYNEIVVKKWNITVLPLDENGSETKLAAKAIAEAKLASIPNPEDINYENQTPVPGLIANAKDAVAAAIEAGWLEPETKQFVGYERISRAQDKINTLPRDVTVSVVGVSMNGSTANYDAEPFLMPVKVKIPANMNISFLLSAINSVKPDFGFDFTNYNLKIRGIESRANNYRWYSYVNGSNPVESVNPIIHNSALKFVYLPYKVTQDAPNTLHTEYDTNLEAPISYDFSQITTDVYNELTEEKVLGKNTDPENLFTDLSLPDELDGAKLTWKSNNPSVISDNGKLINYALLNLDANVSLTATIEKEIIYSDSKYTYPALTKKLNFSVKANSMNDDQKSVLLAAEALSLGDTSLITENIKLPLKGVLGTDISWTSKNLELVSNSGIVTRPSAEDGNKTATLTATISKNGAASKKDFAVTVRALTATGQLAVDIDYDWLTFDIFKGRNREEAQIRHNLVLPSIGEEGSYITWTSNNAASITNEGVVTKNPMLNRGVTMTATITNNGASREKRFSLTVPSNMLAAKTDAIDAALDAFNLVLDPLDLNEITRDEFDQKDRIKEAYAAYSAAISKGASPADLSGYSKVVAADKKMRLLPSYVGISILGNIGTTSAPEPGFFREKTKIRIPAGWTLMQTMVAICNHDNANIKLEYGGGFLATMYGKGPWMYAGITDVQGAFLGAAGYVMEHNDTIWWYQVTNTGADGGLLNTLINSGYQNPFDKDAPCTLDFVTEGVDKSGLSEKIEESKTLESENYRNYASWSGTWESFLSALDYAEKIYAMPSAIQYEVDQAYTLLVSAIGALEPNTPDFSSLNDIIARAESLTKSDYREGWGNVEESLAKARIISSSSFSNNNEIIEAAENLQAAINALVPVKVDTDKTELHALLAVAEQFNKKDYTAISWRGFDLALQNAIVVDKNGSANQEETDNAVADLIAAISRLLPINPKDLSGKVAVSIEAIGDLFVGSVLPWEVMDMAYAGRMGDIDKEKFLQDSISAANESTASSTDIQRTVIALTSIGIDASRTEDGKGNVYNLIDKIANDDRDMQVNALAFALIALDSGNYDVPKDARWTRDALIGEILSTQIYNQGWNWSRDKIVSDVDMTAMVVSALSPYYNSRSDVKKAVDNAMSYLKIKQTGTGSFGSPVNSNSTAMVIIAATSLGIDPATYFGSSQIQYNAVYDLFTQFMTSNKLFGYTDNKDVNRMATEQVFRALLAYDKLVSSSTAQSPYVFAKPVSGSIVDKTVLNQRITELDLLQKDDYENNSWNNFRIALDEAKTVSSSPTLNQTQQIINDALSTLMKAYRELEHADTKPPVIHTTAKTETVTDKRYTFTAYAMDETDGRLHAAVTVNGTVLTGSNDQFAATLVNGKNIIEINASDYSGNSVKETFYVDYNTGGTGETGTITVHFTLNGATKDEQPLHKEVWIKRTDITVNSGASVYDVFKAALDEAGIEFKETQFNYIGRIKSPLTNEWLSEFTNGPNSGWMYMVNNKYPNIGLRDYTVSNDDDIVWVYTNNYKKESNYNPKWDNIGDQSVVIKEIKIGAKTFNGAAKAAVTTNEIRNAIDEAVKDSAENGLIPEVRVSVSNNSSSTSLDITVKSEAIKMISKADKGQLTIQSSLGSITLDNAALNSIIKDVDENSDVVIGIAKANNDLLSAEQQKTAGSNPVFNLSINVQDNPITSFGGTVAVFLPYELDGNIKAEGMTVYYVDKNGKLEEMKNVKYDSVLKGFTFTTTHFSIFMIADKANAADASEINFTDVKIGDWFYEAVKYVYDNKLMNGVSSAEFAPNSNLNRAMLVAMLYRHEGEPDVTSPNTFSDIESGQWYTNSIIWASVNGIVDGYGNGMFGINDDITREQAAAIMMRYAEYKGLDMTITNEFTTYSDASEISSWSLNAMKWANAKGLINGRAANTLSPKGNTTRAEAATLLMRFIETCIK